MPSKADGPQHAYHRSGFGGVWRWATGHGRKRWLVARNWARRRRQKADDPKGFAKAQAAYNKRLEWFKAQHHQGPTNPGNHTVTFDGKPCADWIAAILKDARASHIWGGTMLSGVRTSAQSVALCQAMCGANSCPGTCGGTASNHNCDNCAYPAGACDVTDPAGLEAFCQSHNRPLIGDGRVLPNDVNHFSHAGN